MKSSRQLLFAGTNQEAQTDLSGRLRSFAVQLRYPRNALYFELLVLRAYVGRTQHWHTMS